EERVTTRARPGAHRERSERTGAHRERSERTGAHRERSERTGAHRERSERTGARSTVEVEGREIRLSNLDKVLYPATGFTKGQLIDYYVRVAPAILPHLASRPLTLKRYPDGVDAPHFFEKQCPAHRPSWVTTTPFFAKTKQRTLRFCVAADLPTLVWLAN